jgi:hypothetical protein
MTHVAGFPGEAFSLITGAEGDSPDTIGTVRTGDVWEAA